MSHVVVDNHTIVMIRGTDLYSFRERKNIPPDEADDYDTVYQISYANGKEKATPTKFAVKIIDDDNNPCQDNIALMRNTGTLFHVKEADIPTTLGQSVPIDICTKGTTRDGKGYLAHLEVVMRFGITDQLYETAICGSVLTTPLHNNNATAAIVSVSDDNLTALSSHAVSNGTFSVHEQEFSDVINVTQVDVDNEFAVVNRKKASKRKSFINEVQTKKIKTTVDKQTKDLAFAQLEDLFKNHFPMADNLVKTSIVHSFKKWMFLLTKMDLFISSLKEEIVDCIDIGEDLQRDLFWTFLGNLHRLYHGQSMQFSRTAHEVIISNCSTKNCANIRHIFFLSIRNLVNLGNLLLVDGCLKASNSSLKMADMIPELLDRFNSWRTGNKFYFTSFAYASHEARSIIEDYYCGGNFDVCLVVDATTVDDSSNLLMYLHCVYAHNMQLPHKNNKYRTKYSMSCGNVQCISPKHLRCIQCGVKPSKLTFCMIQRTESHTKRRTDIYKQLVKAYSGEPSSDMRLTKLFEICSSIAKLSNNRVPRQVSIDNMTRLSRNTLEIMVELVDEKVLKLFFDEDHVDCIHNNRIVDILAVAFMLADFGSLDSTRRLFMRSNAYMYNRVQLCQTLNHCCNTNHLNYLGYKGIVIGKKAWKLLPSFLKDSNQEVVIDNTAETHNALKTPDAMVDEILVDHTVPEVIRLNIDVFKECLAAAHKINVKSSGKTYVPDQNINEDSSQLALTWLRKRKHMIGIIHLIEKSDEHEEFNIVQNDLRYLYNLTQSLIVKSDKVAGTYLPDWRKFCGKSVLSSDELRRRYLIEAEIVIDAHTACFSTSFGQRGKYPSVQYHASSIMNRFISFLVASEYTLASAKAEDMITDFTYFNSRSDGAASPRFRCLKLFQTIAFVGQSESPNTIPHAEQSQMLSERTVSKYNEELISILTGVGVIPGTEKEWRAFFTNVCHNLYKKHEKTKAIDVLYPIMKPDLYIALDRIIEKTQLLPCDIADIVFVLLLMETGWRPLGILPKTVSQREVSMKLRHVRFLRNYKGECVLELTPTFSKTSNEHGFAETPPCITEKPHKYCLVRWMLLYLRLRKVVKRGTDGGYVIDDGHKHEPLFVNHISKMFFANPLTIATLPTVMVTIAHALNVPSNQIRAKSFRKGYAIRKAFNLCNENRYTTMEEIEQNLSSCPNWKSKECLTYLNFTNIKFSSILQQYLSAREHEEVKIEEFYTYAYEIGNHRNSLIAHDHPIIISLRKHFFHDVSLEQISGFMNIFVNIMDSSLQRTRRQRSGNMDQVYMNVTLNIDEIVARYPFIMAPEIFTANLTATPLNNRYCLDCQRFVSAYHPQNHTRWDKTIQLAWRKEDINTIDIKV